MVLMTGKVKVWVLLELVVVVTRISVLQLLGKVAAIMCDNYNFDSIAVKVALTVFQISIIVKEQYYSYVIGKLFGNVLVVVLVVVVMAGTIVLSMT